MKRIATTASLLVLAASLALDGLAQDPSPTTGDLHYTAVAPEIDGAFDDAWLNSTILEYPFGEEGHMFGDWENPELREFTTGPEDFSGHLRVLWDEQFFYLWAQLRDDESLSTGAQECWRNDAIELLLDGGNEKTASYDVNDAYLAVRLGGDVESFDPDICTLSVLSREKAIANVVYATALTDTGWVIEMRVPWENVDGEPANGRAIGFNVYADDTDGRTSGSTPQRDVQLSWSYYPTGDAWRDPRAFGTLTFVGGPGGNVANAAFTTDPQLRVLIGEEIAFDASGSSAPAEIVAYEWNFGDGTTGSGVSPTHVFTTPGRYIVTLRVVDSEGAEGTAERAITAWRGIGLPETPLEIPLANGVPEIDGVMDDAWVGAQRIEIATRANNVLPDGPDDLTAEAWVMWDADNFYIFYDVADDDLQFNSANTWEDDSAEFYLDGGYERATAYDASDGQYEMGWSRAGFTGTNPGVTGAEYVARTRDDESGYTVEASLPWSNVSLEAAIGIVFGFEAMVNDDDADDGAGRSHKLSWFAPEGLDQAWTDPSVFGSARLVEEVVSSADPGTDLPMSFAIQSIYPNPFNPSATAVVMAQAAGDYEVQVHNVLGQLVQTLNVRLAAPGRADVSLNLNGEASGIYFVSVRSVDTGIVATARAVFLK